MEIVIKLDDELYNEILSRKYSKTRIEKAVAKGKTLPKGHGRIMDVDKVIKKMEEREEQLKDDRSIWETAGVETALDMFGETIIEVDEEVNNG